MKKNRISPTYALRWELVGIFLLLALITATPSLADNSDKKQNTLAAVVLTSLGEVELLLDKKNAPLTVANFLNYAREGFYNGTLFHRVIPNFMIQGGGFDTSFQQKNLLPPITNEADNRLLNTRGTVAMARTPDPHSATSQFFINVKDNTFLNFRAKSPQGWGYCVFGKVIKGMDIVDKISLVATGNVGHHADVPLKQVTIKHVKIIGDE